jgi:hypothetical protein
MAKSVLVRINKETKDLLDQLLKDNPKVKSYAELMSELLSRKAASKTSELVSNFLTTEKKCTNIVLGLDMDELQVDVAAGKLQVGKPARTDLGHLAETELHLVKLNKSEAELASGLAHMLLARFKLQRARTWLDNLFLYLAVEADLVSDTNQELLRKHGLGLLLISKGKLSLAIDPKEQTNLIANRLRNHGRLGCDNCGAEYQVSEIQCFRCSKRLDFNMYDDMFQTTSPKATNTLQVAIATDPILKKVFRDIKPAIEAYSRELEFRKKGQ